jgi:glycosyltransferase involved in cell wall biosynthesis
MSVDVSFSVIIPTYKAADELRICLDSLTRNSRQDNEIRIYVDPDDSGGHDQRVIDVARSFDTILILNERRSGPYRSWNRGARETEKDVLCFITDDQYWAPDWDSEIANRMDEHPILTGQMVETGVIRPYHTNLIKNVGESAQHFDEDAFLDFVQRNSNGRLGQGGFFSPTVIRKSLFESLGGWPAEKPFPYPNDWLFRLKLFDNGLDYKRVGSSFTYHFQGSSADTGKPKEMHFDRKDPVPPLPGTKAKLFAAFKRGPRWLLRRLGLKRPYVSKSAGYSWPKKIDQRLLYEYCDGQGVEIGPGSNRLANLNTIAVDIVSDFKGREYPRPEIDSTAYELSSIESDSVDFVVNAHVIEHLIDPVRALEEWKRVLKPGGTLFMIVPEKRVKPYDRTQPDTTLADAIERHQLGLQESLDENPSTSSRGDFEFAKFDPNGAPGQRHFSFWTPENLIDVLKHVGFNIERLVEAGDKDTGLDRPGWNYDDFTIVARLAPTD